MRGDERVTDGSEHGLHAQRALRLLEQILRPFRAGEQLFITARTNTPRLSMWRTQSKATALYWCASAFAKLWRSDEPGNNVASPLRPECNHLHRPYDLHVRVVPHPN